MDQLSAMRVFIRVVETGNFTRAADMLATPKATVTNLIQGLEAHLRTKLLNRTTRRVMVTTDGALYYERAAQIISELEELDGSLSNSQSLPSGRLRVEMAGAFADWIVVPALCDFYLRYPDIRIDLGVGDRTVDYLAENVDCALRGGHAGRPVADCPTRLRSRDDHLRFAELHPEIRHARAAGGSGDRSLLRQLFSRPEQPHAALRISPARRGDREQSALHRLG
ncbi:DNA-binding transcriptional LysR family regulator [Rhizobium esperanzae]|nr:DNA-binding transcriptional LysR family regulator [Rhizobium esperanzae]